MAAWFTQNNSVMLAHNMYNVKENCMRVRHEGLDVVVYLWTGLYITHNLEQMN